MKNPRWILLLAVLAAGWLLRDTEPVRRLLHSAKQVAPPVPLPGWGEAAADPARPGASTAGTTGTASRVRKCLRGAEVIYTNERCPAGSREQGLSGGTLTVMPSPVTGTTGPAAASATLRGTLPPPSEVDVREQQVEQALRR